MNTLPVGWNWFDMIVIGTSLWSTIGDVGGNLKRVNRTSGVAFLAYLRIEA